MSERIPEFTSITSSTGTDVITGNPMAIVYGLDRFGQVWTYHNSGWSKLDKMTPREA